MKKLGLSLKLGLLLSFCGIAIGQNAGNEVPNHYIVVVKKGYNTADVLKTHSLSQRVGFSHAIKGFAGQVPAARLAALKKDPRVELVEPDLVVKAVATQTLPTGVIRIGANLSSVANIDGTDQRVNADIAIIDTGIDLTHPDLNVFTNISFVSSASTGNDDNGHGSHVAGIAAAIDNGAGVVGVAPGARLWAVKVLDSTGSGYLSDIIKGIDYVTQNADKIEVANLSLGTQGNSTAMRQAIQNAVAKGVVFVVAAGNDSRDVYGPDGVYGTKDDFIPAAYPEVAAISALADSDGKAGGTGTTTSYGADDTLAKFSNYSRSAAGGTPVVSAGAKIDVAAPGVNIYSTYKAHGYTTMSGTSMASPHVAGAVALYVAANGRANDAAGVTAIRQAIINNSTPQTSWGPSKTNDPDSNHEGLLNANFAAVSGNTAPSIVISSPVSGTNVATDTTISFEAAATDAEDGDLTSQIIWTSNIDGQIGTGGSFTRTLSSGNHTITATVIDSDGLTATATASVIVGSTSTNALTASLTTDRASYRRGQIIRMTIKVTDGTTYVGAAAIRVTLTTPDGRQLYGNGQTNSKGTATFSYAVSFRDTFGTYTLNAAASKTGYNSGSASTTVTIGR